MTILITKPPPTDYIVIPSTTPAEQFAKVSIQTPDASYTQEATVIECIECDTEHLPTTLTLLSSNLDAKNFRNKMETKSVKFIYFLLCKTH
jgi:hypothetical protein